MKSSFKSLWLAGIAVVLLAGMETELSAQTVMQGLAGQWKLNQKESDNPREKFQQAAAQKGDQKEEHRKSGGAYGESKGQGRMRGKAENLFDAPDSLSIEINNPEVKITDSKGNTRVLYTDGRKSEKVVDKERTLTFFAKWEEDALVVTAQGPDGGNLTESYYLSPDGKQLYVKLEMRPVFMDHPITIIRVYDPPAAETQTQTQSSS